MKTIKDLSNKQKEYVRTKVQDAVDVTVNLCGLLENMKHYQLTQEEIDWAKENIAIDCYRLD
jgi:hypothetical protein